MVTLSGPDADDVEIVPVTATRWPDLEKLFGPRGACGGCWCMWWRVTAREYELLKGDPARDAFRGIVESGEAPGLLAYAAGEAIGWCAVGPRAEYPRLGRSRLAKSGDDALRARGISEEDVWAVSCFFIARQARRSGLTGHLLEAAVKHARAEGARVVEGYPTVPRKADVPAAFAYTGFLSTFMQAGFVPEGTPSASRRLMRRYLDSG